MDHLPTSKILKFNPNTFEEVRELYNLHKPGDMKNAVDILDRWVKSQNHFIKKDYKREYLEITLIMCKGSIERAKLRIDKLCTLRTHLPQYFGDYDIRDFTDIHENIKISLLPRLTEDNNRIYLARFDGGKMESYSITNYLRRLIMVLEYAKLRDYSAGYLIFVDAVNANYSEIFSILTLAELRQAVALIIEAYGVRMKGIYFWVKPNKFVELIFQLFKQVLPKKIEDRIHLLQSLEEVHSFLPKKVLPVEYSGEEIPLDTLYDELVDEVNSEKHREYLRDMNTAKTDESLRQTDKFNDMYIGMPGTFRSLSVD